MAAPNTLSAILKLIQAERLDETSLARKAPGLASVPHLKDFQGESFKWSVNHSGYGGRSHDAVQAETNDVNGAYSSFTVSSTSDFKYGKLNGALVRKALNGGVNTQFVDYTAHEMNLSVGALNANLAKGFYGSATGARGQVGSFTGATITLKSKDDAMYWSIGDVLKMSATDGAAHETGSLTVTKVNSGTGVLTFSGNVTSGIATAANDYFLYAAGDLNASWMGLGSYCPASDPSGGDSFAGGLNRSVNPEMLAGLRLSFSGANTETVLIRAAAYCRKRPTSAFDKYNIICSEEDFAGIQVAKEGSRFVDSENEYGIGITKFMVGSAPVVPDAFCPTGTYFIVGEGAMELHTNNGVQIDETDENQIRKTAGDTYTFAAVVDGQFTCPKPYGVARGTWPAG